MATEGAPEGTVIVAKSQTAGKGRFDRCWVSPEGGLYMSLILRPRMELIPPFTLAGALALVDGIGEETQASPMIRWPNDVLLNGKKVGGVLAEANFSGGTLSFVVVGIGANCNFGENSLGELSKTSTTLRDSTGKDVNLVSLREKTLDSFAGLYSKRPAELVGRVRAVLSTLGRRVAYETVRGRSGSGRAEEMQQDGSLRVVENGVPRILRPEEIRWLREE